jgi:16S rRNA (adenine1518-N6/adenine1519-N6)-dimethyltransferase
MVVRAAFFNRRKKIVNSMALSKFGTEAEVSSMLAAAGIDESRRAETVSLAEYVSLAKIAANKNK